jgi:transcriptional regulator with XRE-family HTH domain
MTRKPAKLSDQIRQAVDRSGMSRYRICKIIGLDEGMMSRFMSRKMGLSVRTLDNLAAVLRLTIVSGLPKTGGTPARRGRGRKVKS